MHMVTHDESGGRLRAKLFPRSSLARRRQLLGWGLAVALPVVATLIGVLLRQSLILSTNVIDYFLATIIVALVGGLGPALFASTASALLLNFFFTPPLYTLTVDAQQNVITLIAMVVVAFALVVDRAARRADAAARARTEAALLASYARTVLGDGEPLQRLLEKVRENFGLESVSLLEKQDDEWVRAACTGERPCDDPDEADVDVPVADDVHLALRGRTLPAHDQRVLEAAAGQALLALRQQRMAEQTQEAQRRAETTELRTALLSAIGHDLRTPLTSIKAVFGGLRAHDVSLSEEDAEELLAAGEESTDRLSGLIDNLLDSSRLATGAVQPVLHPVGYDEVVATALTAVDGGGKVAVDADAGLPAVTADAGLLERAIANVIDNALRHGGGEVAVRASAYAGRVELRIVDHGRGLPKGAADSAFAPFQRLGDRNTTTGVGLGLSVAKGFVEAMDGDIRAEDTPGGGLTVVMSLPIATEVVR
jgi:two-component system sensor histidine kinase KdpD